MEAENQHPNPVTSQRGTTWRFPSVLVHLSSLDWPHQKFRSMLRSRGKWLDLTFQRNFFRDVFKSPLSLPDCPPFALSSSFLSAAWSRNVTSAPSFVSLLLDGSDVLHLHQYRVVHKIWSLCGLYPASIIGWQSLLLLGNGCATIPTPFSTIILGSAFLIESFKDASNCVTCEPSNGMMFVNDEQENVRQQMAM